ncbi:pirin family protein [Rhodoblastus acidophilus]|uniref:Pirin family protein n=1 Tax=Candidatus Rhodoblastus alkanivorans TaxID=2954117 RepID=A0ABS9Z1Y2_9HYPH|nr:pirin family protein [Candidatus Rhodoblastus alkanivorans]MCI4680659.1 pirin family protein [Candidatus Rhodoblastus alkanivorans]MCI4681669.1 pirin family protein [Candidatus Rhodoblastus alkanivorans]MDI4642717.1 pirin family protein [Rhodoblastus acidophilus]
MTLPFVLRANERGHDVISSDGPTSSYVAGHPGAFISRESSFNFHQYQGGRPGFGPIRVFGDETFHGAGCGYNMHPHHNFVICAFVLEGELTHINTAGEGTVDRLRQGDYYVFSAGSGGKHCELSISPENMNAIYLWALPNQLYLPPTYHRSHFDLRTRRNQIVQLVGDADGALPFPQDLRVSRLVTDRKGAFAYTLRSAEHGVYFFVVDGSLTYGATVLGRRDSLGVSGAQTLEFEVADTTDVLIVETAMVDDERIRAWEKEQPQAA